MMRARAVVVDFAMAGIQEDLNPLQCASLHVDRGSGIGRLIAAKTPRIRAFGLRLRGRRV